MCLVALALHARADTALVVAANRDELYGRPSAPLGFWPGAPFVLAGRDLSGGGTWMGITRGLRFAALTNVRDPTSMRSTAPSRGLLVSEYLLGAESPAVYLRAVAARAAAYNPFNLLAGDLKSGELLLLESRDGAVRPLPPGLYGLSNASLDTPWPKLVRLREALRALLERAAAPSPEELLAPLADRVPPPDRDLPDTGVGLAIERALAPAFIETERYGTRSSTCLIVRSDGAVSALERTFSPGERPRDVRVELPAPAG